MNFTTLCKERYSCKSFCEKEPLQDKLDAILEAGRLAPTAKNLQEQKIYVMRSADAIAKIDAATPCRYGAPVVLVVAYDKNNVFTYPGEKHDSGVEDATIVATSMLLAAYANGVDSCWLNFFNPEELHASMNLPENEEIVMLMDLGYASENFKPTPMHADRKPIEETVSYR